MGEKQTRIDNRKSNELTNENRILKSNEVRFMRKVEEENKLDIFFKSTNIY